MTRKTGLAGFLFFVVFFVCVTAIAAQPPEERRLTILFTHDLHSYFLPQRHAEPGGGFVLIGGFARLAAAIEEERTAHGDAVLLLDAGDFSMGTLFHTLFMKESCELRLLDRMGYDAVTIGNHEYDFKPDGLARALAAAREKIDNPPVITASNVVFTDNDPRDRSLKEEFQRYPVQDYLVIERNGVRVGIFGILGKKAQVDAPFATPVTFSDPVEECRRVVNILRNREKVDIVICLSHTGTSPEKKYSEDEHIAAKVPGIDILISGHTHTVFTEPVVVGDTYIVSAGCYGAFLGIIETAVSPEEKLRVLSYKLRTISSDIPEDEAIAAEIRSFRKLVNDQILAPLDLSFNQVIAHSDFSSKTLAAMSKHPGETGLGNLITDSYRFAVEKAEGDHHEYVHVAIQPVGHIRDYMRKGPLSAADVFRILSLGIGPDGRAGYPLITGWLTGRELKQLMEVETTVSAMKRDAHLQVSGLRCVYNPRRLPFDRVMSLEVQDETGAFVPVESDRLYRIAANLYTAYMVDYISNVSHGLLSMELKDSRGAPLEKMTDGIVTGPEGEVKEWLSLVSYLQSFSVKTGDGLPDIPARYAAPEGRIQVKASWNPVNLVRGGTAITWTVVALLAVIIAAPFLIVALMHRRRLKKLR
ncbi:MAG TPA: bifunctional metallophosphatase/5'-nucleotidase [Deltaproteobacteria bacterium]|nr:bifunctional metallophosphatase/5'-nucleotidase [Deltaproteobacteria bacterium]